MEAQAAGNVREELQELGQEVREKSKAMRWEGALVL